MTMGFSNVLAKGKKKPWPALPLTVGAYTVKDSREVAREGEEVKSYHFRNLDCRTYDPVRIVPEHCKRANFRWSSQHVERPDEDERRNWYNANRHLAPGIDSDREGEEHQNLGERSQKLGGSSSSKDKRTQTGAGPDTADQQREAEAQAKLEEEKKRKEDEEKRKKDARTERKRKKEEEKERQEKEAQAAAEKALKEELDKVDRQKKAEQAAAARREQ